MKELVKLLEGYVQKAQRTLIEAGLKIGFVQHGDAARVPVDPQYRLPALGEEVNFHADNALYDQLLETLEAEHRQMAAQVQPMLQGAFDHLAAANPTLWLTLQKNFQSILYCTLLGVTADTGSDTQAKQRITGYLANALIAADAKTLERELATEINHELTIRSQNYWQQQNSTKAWTPIDKIVDAVMAYARKTPSQNCRELSDWDDAEEWLGAYFKAELAKKNPPLENCDENIEAIYDAIFALPFIANLGESEAIKAAVKADIKEKNKNAWQKCDPNNLYSEEKKHHEVLSYCIQQKFAQESDAFWLAVAPLSRDDSPSMSEQDKAAYMADNASSLPLSAETYIQRSITTSLKKYPNFAAFMLGEFEPPTDIEMAWQVASHAAVGSACNKAIEATLLRAKETGLISDYTYRLSKVWTALNELGSVIKRLKLQKEAMLNAELGPDQQANEQTQFLKNIATMVAYSLASLAKDYAGTLSLATNTDRVNNESNYLHLLPENVRFLLSEHGLLKYTPTQIQVFGNGIQLNFLGPRDPYAGKPFILANERSDFSLQLELTDDRSAIKHVYLNFDVNELAHFEPGLQNSLRPFTSNTLHSVLSQFTTGRDQNNSLAEMITISKMAQMPGALSKASIVWTLEKIARGQNPKSPKSAAIQLCRTWYTLAEQGLKAGGLDPNAREALAVIMLTSRDYIQKNGRWWQSAPSLTRTIDTISRGNPTLSVGFTSPKSELERLVAEDLDLSARQQRFVDRNFPAGKVVNARDLGYVINNLLEQLSHQDFKIRSAASAKLQALLADQRKITVVNNPECTVQKATLDYLLTKAQKNKFKALSPTIKADLAECLQTAYVQTYWQGVDPVVARPVLQPEFAALLDKNGSQFKGFQAFNTHLLQVYEASSEYRVALLPPDVLEVDELYRQAFDDNGKLIHEYAKAQADTRLKDILHNDTNYEFFSALLNNAHKKPYARIVNVLRSGCLQDEFDKANKAYQKKLSSVIVQEKVAPLSAKPLVLAEPPKLAEIFNGFVKAARRITPKDVNDSLRTTCERGSWFSNGVKQYDETSESGNFRLCAMHEIFALQASTPLVRLALQLASGAKSAGMVTGQVFSSLGHFVNDVFMTAADRGWVKFGAIAGRYEDEAKLVQNTFTHKNHTVFGDVLSVECSTKPIIGLTTTLTITDNQSNFDHRFDYDLTIFDLAASFVFFQQLTSDYKAIEHHKHYKAQIKPYTNLPELFGQIRSQIFATLREQLAYKAASNVQLADTAATNVRLDLTSEQQQALYDLVFASPDSLAEFLGDDVANADKNLCRLLALFNRSACKQQANAKITSWFYYSDLIDEKLSPFLANFKIWMNEWDPQSKDKEKPLIILGYESVMPSIFANEKSLLIFLQSAKSPVRALQSLWEVSASQDNQQQQHLLAKIYHFYARQEKDPELEKLLLNADVLTFLIEKTNTLVEAATCSKHPFDFAQGVAPAVISSIFASEQTLLAFLGEKADGPKAVAKFNQLMKFCGTDKALKIYLNSEISDFLYKATIKEDSLLAKALVTPEMVEFVCNATDVSSKDLAEIIRADVTNNNIELSLERSERFEQAYCAKTALPKDAHDGKASSAYLTRPTADEGLEVDLRNIGLPSHYVGSPVTGARSLHQLQELKSAALPPVLEHEEQPTTPKSKEETLPPAQGVGSAPSFTSSNSNGFPALRSHIRQGLMETHT